MFIALMVTAFAFTSESGLSDYKAELLARTNGESTYNLPSHSYMNSTSPSINDSGDVAFKIISAGFDQHADHSEQAAIWLKKHNEIYGRIVYFGPPSKMLSDANVTDHGKVLFTVFDEMKTDGLFAFDIESQKAEAVFSATKMFALSFPQSAGSGNYIFRSTDFENSRTFYEYAGGELSSVITEDSGYAYLFGPSVNQASQWVFKARLGEKNNWPEEAADQIVMLKPEFNMFGEKEYSRTVIAQDKDGNPLWPYMSFDNSPMISDSGYVVFVATIANGKRVIVAVRDEIHHVVVREGENDISEIELFSPKINDQGLVVFRAKNDSGVRGIYLAQGLGARTRDSGSPHEIKKLIGEGDSISADVESAVILKREGFPGFAGNVDINNRNEIVFSAILATPDHKWIYGSAVYKLHPL